MAQYLFGSGVFWGTPLTDAQGNAIAVPTPVQLGTMQEISIDISFDSKELYGQQQFPVAVARGKGKMTGKAKVAQISATALNALFFGQSLSNGLIGDVCDLLGAAIPATPFAVTVTPPSGTWAANLGVRDADGIPMTAVASGATPTAGQYKAVAGVYTFAAADVGKKVFISYQYTTATATARKSTVSNLLMGHAPTFRGDLYLPYSGKSLVLTIPSCVSNKWGIGTKNDDFVIPDFEFQGFADAAGNALYWSSTDA